MHIDLDNIKPYIPTDNHHKPDIDLVYNISNNSNITTISNISRSTSPQPQNVNVNVISEDKANECDTFSDSDNDIDSDSLSSDDDIHPVLAALDAPIWSPDDIDAIHRYRF